MTGFCIESLLLLSSHHIHSKFDLSYGPWLWQWPKNDGGERNFNTKKNGPNKRNIKNRTQSRSISDTHLDTSTRVSSRWWVIFFAAAANSMMCETCTLNYWKFNFGARRRHVIVCYQCWNVCCMQTVWRSINVNSISNDVAVAPDVMIYLSMILRCDNVTHFSLFSYAFLVSIIISCHTCTYTEREISYST